MAKPRPIQNRGVGGIRADNGWPPIGSNARQIPVSGIAGDIKMQTPVREVGYQLTISREYMTFRGINRFKLELPESSKSKAYWMLSKQLSGGPLAELFDWMNTVEVYNNEDVGRRDVACGWPRIRSGDLRDGGASTNQRAD